MSCLLWLALLMAPQPHSSLEAAVREFDGTVGLAAKDLDTGEQIVVNADTRFPTASTIKTAVMLEAWHQASHGKLAMEDRLVLRDADKVGGSGVLNGMSDGLALPIRDLLHLMMVLSDNTATNLLVNRLGTKQINDRLLAYGLTETKIFRPTFRDGRADVHPELEREFGLGMSTPREMARLMELIATGRAVSPAASEAMHATLRGQTDRAMIPRLLPAGVRTGNKTGTDSEKLADDTGHRGAIRADAAIVTSERSRGRDTRGGVDNDAVLLGARLARIVHDHFNR